MTPPFTREALLEEPLQALGSLWLCIRCVGCSATTDMPLKLLAARHGKLKLGAVLERLRCSSCGAKPAAARVCDDPNDSGLGGRRQTWSVTVLPGR